MISGRALHFVFKIGDRAKTAVFYRDILGMTVLRHEEFTEGCEAACNGPYDNRWSKTMVGYGPESTHFAIELTYNYNVKSYTQGNDFRGITIRSKESIQRAKQMNWPLSEKDGEITIEAPGGYKFLLIDESQPTTQDPVEQVHLASSDIKKTVNYWNNILGLHIFQQTEETVFLGFDAKQTKIVFRNIGGPVDHAQSYGRIAFSCPSSEQPSIDERIKKAGHQILTPLITLDTPGKATVRVIILADPDGHEICFVDEEGFSQLSKVEEKSNAMLDRYIAKDAARK